MSGSPYQIALLGALDTRANQIQRVITSLAAQLGLPKDRITFLRDGEVGGRLLDHPTVALFFGAKGAPFNQNVIDDLIRDSCVIVPVVSDIKLVFEEIPLSLRHINALEARDAAEWLPRLGNLVLENFRLLRKTRRIFISYRRIDSQPFAETLYNALDSRGFDVFIDLRSVPPADDFQEVLWHRMSDSDVVVLIDTPGFRKSRWTTEELARANSTNIQILHLLWPGQKEDSNSAFSHFMKLSRWDFHGLTLRGRWPTKKMIERVCDEAETLRARAIAARHRYLVDNFCDAAKDAGLTAHVQPDGWISLEDRKSNRVAVVPAVGVPTADRINQIFTSAARFASGFTSIWVIYDNRGILSAWLDHIDWLDEHLPIKTVQMARVPSTLSGGIV